jgi:hypothetical protein
MTEAVFVTSARNVLGFVLMSVLSPILNHTTVFAHHRVHSRNLHLSNVQRKHALHTVRLFVKGVAKNMAQ